MSRSHAETSSGGAGRSLTLMSSTRRGGTCFRARQRRQRLLEAVCSGFRSYQFECGDDTAKDGLADPTSFTRLPPAANFGGRPEPVGVHELLHHLVRKRPA
jgi:hypothetical protein